MGKFHETIQDSTREFIAKQHIFFVATAPLTSEGHINLSPKGLDAFRILSPTKVAYMDLIGSGNETAAHIFENRRITFMFCSFDKVPNILRLYGNAYTVSPKDSGWEELSTNFKIYPSTRQIIVADNTKSKHHVGMEFLIMSTKVKRPYTFIGLKRKVRRDLKIISQKRIR